MILSVLDILGTDMSSFTTHETTYQNRTTKRKGKKSAEQKTVSAASQGDTAKKNVKAPDFLNDEAGNI